VKNSIYILAFFLSLSCSKQIKEVTTTTSNEKKTTANKTSSTKQDTILITTELLDTLKYSKNDFKNIIDKHPEFSQQYPENPDQTYFNGNDKEEFGSEAGQDTYYILYAYFLKQKNGEKKFSTQRQKLIDIYSNINSLFGHFEYGGTYFGHQSTRILGYAEYSIYLMPKSKNDIYKTYDITKQKELYIKSLRQLIEDESKIDFNTLGKEKVERNEMLNKIVDELDKLITDNFYLRRAQEFQYEHYESY